MFLRSADDLYGPITTVRSNGRVVKKIPWTAFQLQDADWKRVRDVKNILKVTLMFPALIYALTTLSS
jgi:hypothetical protein